jgi:predicted transcriptional regulator
MTVRHTSRQHLTELQQAILDFLWTNGPATSEQVREALLPKHRLKDPSVRTLLRRMEKRGYLSHRLEGKVFVYQAETRPHSVAAGAVRQIIDRFWSGSVDRFLVGMVDENVLTLKQIKRLARRVRNKK